MVLLKFVIRHDFQILAFACTMNVNGNRAGACTMTIKGIKTSSQVKALTTATAHYSP